MVLPLLMSQVAQAQLNYAATSCSDPYVQAQGQAGTTLLGVGDDVIFPTVTLPFPFTFYFTSFTQVNVGTNGFVVFQPGTNRGLGNATLPTAIVGAALYPYWDDLDADALVNPNCGVYTRTDGVAPNRIFTIEWYQIGHFNHDAQGGDITFQVRLFENGNRIQYKYLDTQFAGTQAANSNGASATVGLEGIVATPRPNTLVGFNVNGSVTSGQCIEFILPTPCNPIPTGTVTVGTSADLCVANATIAIPSFNPAGCANGTTTGLRYSVNGGAFTNVTLPAATVTIPNLPRGSNVITWQTYLIANGATTGVATQTVIVVDSQPPTITCPANITYNLDPGLCSTIHAYNVTATDNCPGPTQSLNQNLGWPQVVDIALVCSNAAPDFLSYYRVFNVTQNLTANSINLGVWRATPGSPFTIKLYSLSGAVTNPINQANMTLLSTTVYNPTAIANATTINIPLTPTPVTAGTQLVVEIGAAGTATPVSGSSVGFDLDGESAPTYVYGCFNTAGVPAQITGGINDLNFFSTRGLILQLNLSAPAVTLVQTAGLPSGSEFPIGKTTNCFLATDATGNTSTCCFDVTVLEFPNPVQTLVCNDLVYVSLDADCTESLGADQILEGGPYGCYDDYIVQIDKTPPFGNGPWVPAILGPADIGKTYAVQVTDPATGNKCWGNVKIEDKLAPVLVCPPASVACNSNPDPATPPSSVTFSPSQNFVIADAAVTTVNFNVAPGASVNDLNVVFKTNHTWVGDISATLTSPSGTQITLFNRPTNGTCQGDGLDVVFDDAATLTAAQFVATCGNNPAIAGTYQPATALSTFNGQPTGGVWILRVTDFVGGDLGPVSFAQLNFSATTQSPGFPNGLTINQTVFPTGTPQTYTVPAGSGSPVVENCSDVTLSYQDAEVTQDCASGLTKIVNRKWTAIDASGNTKTCVQVLSFLRPTLADLTFPPDYDGVDEPALQCGVGYPTPQALENSGLQGFPYVFNEPDGCNINWTYEDSPIQICDGTLKIFREWKAIDWCAGTSAKHDQIIKILDEQGPSIACPANLTVSTDPFTCCAQINLPDVIISDNCSRINNISGMIIGIDPSTLDTIGMFPIGGSLTTFPGNNLWNPDTLGAFGTSPCLPQGTHTVVYQAEDDCGNTSTCTFRINVRDFVPPVAACDEFTIVSIGLDDPFDCYEPADGCDGAGVTWVKASTFDDGSYDNCNNIKLTIKRLPDMVTGSYSQCIQDLNSINGHPDCDDFFPDFPNEFERAYGRRLDQILLLRSRYHTNGAVDGIPTGCLRQLHDRT
ncbi:MAG: HYR domain-containing protein [Lewinellaceae bacterium]|nr:HYR domain-containing protein [Lewinellaceae bacterium]